MSKIKKDLGNMKILADLADLADDCVAISWKTKIWKFKIQKKTLRIMWNLQKKSAKSAKSARENSKTPADFADRAD